MHSFFNFKNSINFLFISLFFLASYKIFTLTFSSMSFFYLFQFCICCLYSSYPCCSLICFNNPYFFSSTIINLLLSDLTSKPRLPIFRLIITIVWNISTILFLANIFYANSFIDFGVKFYGDSSLDASSNDIPVSLICKPKSISNPCPFIDHGLLCGSTMANGLKSSTDALLTPWRTQKWVPNRTQQKNKESRHAP
jgi:hypothetical protein